MAEGNEKTISILLSILCVIALAGCSTTPLAPSSPPPEPGILKNPLPSGQTSQAKGNTIRTITIQVGNKNFRATLYDNDSTRALTAKLPLTLNMDELNGNEKFYFFPEKFPTNSEQVGSIKTGDLMLYGSDCLVLFYKNFSTSYSYTRLGYVEDANGLAAALGSGSVQVTFSAP